MQVSITEKCHNLASLQHAINIIIADAKALGIHPEAVYLPEAPIFALREEPLSDGSKVLNAYMRSTTP